MNNTAENLILDRFSDEELEKADLGRLRMLAKELRDQRDINDQARAAAAANLNDLQRNQDRLAEALMIVLGDPIEALIEARIESALPDRFSDLLMEGFDIYEHQSEIEHMINEQLDERVGEPESEDDRQAAVEEIVKDVLSGASISIDI
jgi:hypothetical protein